MAILHSAAPAALAAGFALGASLIIAIGAQNAFVLRQGLRRNHVAVVVAICIACDVALIALGAVGFGSLVGRFPALVSVAAWGGAAFLAGYGTLALRSALYPAQREEPAETTGPASAGRVAVATLAISLLNPHVYLDTVVLLGAVAAQYSGSMRFWFAAGACVASAAWFTTLGFGARALAPVFGRPVAWRVLDVVIGIIMWSIAISLAVGQLR